MLTAKDEVKNILTNLPEDCSLEDIQYHVYVKWSPKAIEDLESIAEYIAKDSS